MSYFDWGPLFHNISTDDLGQIQNKTNLQTTEEESNTEEI